MPWTTLRCGGGEIQIETESSWSRQSRSTGFTIVLAAKGDVSYVFYLTQGVVQIMMLDVQVRNWLRNLEGQD